MYFVVAVALILTSTIYYYRASKLLRECVAYSKQEGLSIGGNKASHEISLMSNPVFMLKLVFGSGVSYSDSTQGEILKRAKGCMLLSYAIGLVAVIFVVLHVLLR